MESWIDFTGCPDGHVVLLCHGIDGTSAELHMHPDDTENFVANLRRTRDEVLARQRPAA